MPLTKKAYFTLEEIEERWSLPRRDISYLAENGLLRLSVRSPGLMIERVYTECGADGEWFDVAYDQAWYAGLLDLLERDVSTLFQDGLVNVRAFRCGGEFVRLIEPTRVHTVKLCAVVVLREERDKVELEQGLGSRESEPAARAQCASPPVGRNLVGADPRRARVLILDEGRHVIVGDVRYRLGEVQARVVNRLHAAAVAGTPWVDGKRLLHDVGSRSLRVSNLVKSQPRWRELIQMDGRGNYRIAADPCNINLISGMKVRSRWDDDPTSSKNSSLTA